MSLASAFVNIHPFTHFSCSLSCNWGAAASPSWCGTKPRTRLSQVQHNNSHTRSGPLELCIFWCLHVLHCGRKPECFLDVGQQFIYSEKVPCDDTDLV